MSTYKMYTGFNVFVKSRVKCIIESKQSQTIKRHMCNMSIKLTNHKDLMAE